MATVPIRPLKDYVLAKQEEAVSKTASGLYLPDKSSEKPKIATVFEVGKAVKEIKTGDKIVYKSYATTDIKVSGVEYLLIKEEDILALITE